MLFKKRSEDSWDQPRRSVVAYTETEEEPAPTVQNAPEPQEEPAPACPWCGGVMERGCLVGGRGLWLTQHKPNFLGFGTGQQYSISDGILNTYRECWVCGDCRKLVADVPEPCQSPFETKIDEQTERREDDDL